MESARWQRIQELFHAVVDLPTAEQRAYLSSACQDSGIIADVIALVDADARGVSPIDGDVAELAGAALGAFEPPAFAELAPYRIVRLLGEGGMGVVYLAERTDLGSHVALKVLRDAWLSPARRERFSAEQRTLAQLNHHAIARLYDAGVLADGTPFFVMEYVEGEAITAHCHERALSLDARLALFRSLCEAVQYAHGRAVIHRDIKPSNVLVKCDGSVRLLDFGIAKHLDAVESGAARTRTGFRLLTPDYAAPEQIANAALGTFTDVYALGVVLYEMLTGRLPFDRARFSTLALEAEADAPSKAARGTALGASIGKAQWADLNVIVLTAMASEPRRRYPTVEALIRDVDHFRDALPLDARPASVMYELRKFVTRHVRGVAAAAAVTVGVVALTGFFLTRLTRERNRADRQAAIATSINQFLADDLLERINPLASGSSRETLVEAIERASPDIDRQFAAEPAVAGRLHETIAEALATRTAFPAARRELERASVLFARCGDTCAEDRIVAELRRAIMETRTREKGSIDLARKIVADEEAAFAALGRRVVRAPIWLAYARGSIAIAANDGSAVVEMQRAVELARAVSTSEVGAATRLRLRQYLAWSYLRMGDGKKAETAFRDIMNDLAATRGSGEAPPPEAQLMRLNVSQALLIQRRYREALAEVTTVLPLFVSVLAVDHDLSLQALGTKAEIEGHLELWDASAADNLEAHRIAVIRYGADSLRAIATLSDASLSQCRAGRFAEGESAARDAYESARKQSGDRSGIAAGTGYALASCLVGLSKDPNVGDHLTEAAALLQGMNLDELAHLDPASDWPNERRLLLAEIALLRGDLPETRRLLDEARPGLSGPDVEAYLRRKIATLTVALEARSH